MSYVAPLGAPHGALSCLGTYHTDRSLPFTCHGNQELHCISGSSRVRYIEGLDKYFSMKTRMKTSVTANRLGFRFMLMKGLNITRILFFPLSSVSGLCCFSFVLILIQFSLCALEMEPDLICSVHGLRRWAHVLHSMQNVIQSVWLEKRSGHSYL